MIKNGLKLPDFIIGGAARCGTTTLYELLKTIDEIYLPPNKRPEPHFFLKSWEFAKGLEYYSTKYFKDAKEGQVIGECSTSYLYRYDLADKIKKYLGNIKWIFILRNPLDRLISQYFFNIGNKIEYNDINFAIRYERERVESTILHWKEIAPFDYTGRSLYSKGIKKYMEDQGYERIADFRGRALKYIVKPEAVEYKHVVAELIEAKCTGCGICVRPGCCEAIELKLSLIHI